MHPKTSKVNQIRRNLLSSDESFKTNSKDYGVIINFKFWDKAGSFCHSKTKRAIPKLNLKHTRPQQKEVEEFSKRRLQHMETCRLTNTDTNSSSSNPSYSNNKINLMEALHKMRSYGLQLKELRRSNKPDSFSISCPNINKGLNDELPMIKSISMPSMEEVYDNISKISLSDTLTKWKENMEALGDDALETTNTEELFSAEDLLIYYRGISEGTITDEESPSASARYRNEP